MQVAGRTGTLAPPLSNRADQATISGRRRLTELPRIWYAAAVDRLCWVVLHQIESPQMAYLVGTDEAGYGPKLGPLIISSSLWKIPDDRAEVDLYDMLAPAVSSVADPGNPSQVVIADSKQLYQSGGGLGGLEKSLFPALSIIGQREECWTKLWQALAPGSDSQWGHLPWYKGFDLRLPCATTVSQIELLTNVLRTALENAGVLLMSIQSTAIFPQRMNERIEASGNKSTVLSEESLDLVKRMIEPLDNEPVRLIFDKHGGRNRYAALLQHAFPDEIIQVVEEGRRESIYRCGRTRRMEMRFVVKGERFLPAALASVTSKYLRELAMRALNHFWCDNVQNLKPTAGYPVDARRFRLDIQTAQNQMGVSDRILWRDR